MGEIASGVFLRCRDVFRPYRRQFRLGMKQRCFAATSAAGVPNARSEDQVKAA
jgi:hypothetical protein